MAFVSYLINNSTIIYQQLLLYFDIFAEVRVAVSHINMVINSKNIGKSLWKTFILEEKILLKSTPQQQNMVLLQAQ